MECFQNHIQTVAICLVDVDGFGEQTCKLVKENTLALVTKEGIQKWNWKENSNERRNSLGRKFTCACSGRKEYKSGIGSYTNYLRNKYLTISTLDNIATNERKW